MLDTIRRLARQRFALHAQATSLSAELADAKQRAREERRQLSLELASTRTEVTPIASTSFTSTPLTHGSEPLARRGTTTHHLQC